MQEERKKVKNKVCLGELLQIQNYFQKRYYPIEKINISSLASAIACEAMEIWASSGKWWYKNHRINLEKIKEESVDIFHFLLALYLKLEMNEYEIEDLYKRKMRTNIRRQKQNTLSTESKFLFHFSYYT